MNCMAYTYFITLMCCQMHIHLIASSLLSAMFLPCTDLSQPGWLHVDTYMHLLKL